MVSSTARDCQPKTQSALPLGEASPPYPPLRILVVVVLGLGPFFGWTGCVPATPGKRPRTKDDDEEDSDET
jgi:hypothetical protein